jgi:imidazolonepropionase
MPQVEVSRRQKTPYNPRPFLIMSLLICNIGELFDGRRIVKDTSLFIEEGRIASVGSVESAEVTLNAGGRFVMPGFVDPHTHAVFASTRAFEIGWKAAGLSYRDIAAKGGGIMHTVRETRTASTEQLFAEACERLLEMLRHGTTTVEVKSGYGLDTATELKMLEVVQMLQQHLPLDVVPTFLAHALPEGLTPDAYVDHVVSDMIPRVGRRHLAEFCDVFCEEGYFSVDHTRRILQAAADHGMAPKMHADEFSCTGCSDLAAELHAVSADHLLASGPEQMRKMAAAGVVATLLPATPFVLNERYPDARAMLQHGLRVALATDFNPNCYVLNMQFVVQLACYALKLTPLEALTAATRGAAAAVRRDHEIGSLEPGKKGDALIMDVPTHEFVFYKVGVNLVRTVVKNGEVVVYSQE